MPLYIVAMPLFCDYFCVYFTTPIPAKSFLKVITSIANTPFSPSLMLDMYLSVCDEKLPCKHPSTAL